MCEDKTMNARTHITIQMHAKITCVGARKIEPGHSEKPRGKNLQNKIGSIIIAALAKQNPIPHDPQGECIVHRARTRTKPQRWLGLSLNKMKDEQR